MAEMPGADDLGIRLDALRARGAAECDPVGFAYLEALNRRAASQPAAVRQILLAKLDQLSKTLAARLNTEPDRHDNFTAEATSPLAALLAHIGQQANAPQPMPGQPATVNPEKRAKSASTLAARTPELKAVSIFREDWRRLSAEQQLTQTLAQAPANAGPMNSQHLVLCSLERMRDMAPDYLQGFISYIDTLIWLELADPKVQKGQETKP